MTAICFYKSDHLLHMYFKCGILDWVCKGARHGIFKSERCYLISDIWFQQTIMIPGPKLNPEDEFENLNYQIPKPKAVQWYK